jgi:hypothetical protein
MKKLVIAILFAAMTLMAGSARADMTYASFLLGGGRDQSGNPIADGTYSMLIDLDGDGWNGTSYLSQALAPLDNSLSWLWDPEDFLMDVGQIVNGDAFPFKTIPTADIPATYNANVDPYYLFWFNKPFNLADAGPGQGIFYGAEILGTVGTDPGDYTPIAVGGIAQFQTTQVIPEPVSTVLALIGGGAMALRRRFIRTNA